MATRTTTADSRISRHKTIPFTQLYRSCRSARQVRVLQAVQPYWAIQIRLPPTEATIADASIPRCYRAAKTMSMVIHSSTVAGPTAFLTQSYRWTS